METRLEHHPDDLIVARATSGAPAALAVVRLDGDGAAAAIESLFRPLGGAPSPTRAPRAMVLGRWLDPSSGELIDEGLAVFFPAPHSYTGNDVAEFHCHGAPLVARRLVQAVLDLGGRLAEPGEFTRRAFLNGKIDLIQAEAVADLINAQTEAAARLARAQYAGGLSEEINGLRRRLIDLGAQIEAAIDFPDEDLETADRERLAEDFAQAARATARLLATRRRGRLLREGARVALAGRPNAGKSSLFNALARAERAIVTPHPGTTRDTIECSIDLEGMPITLVDMAGLRSSLDPIERLGIERAWREIERADLVVLVHDASGAEPPELEAEAAEVSPRPPDLIVFNKIDLLGGPPPPAALTAGIPISATRGDGLERLERELAARLLGGGGEGPPDLAVNLRHGELLERTGAALEAAREGWREGRSGELIMVDLREGIDALGEAVGLETGDAILDALFSRFCVGK